MNSTPRKGNFKVTEELYASHGNRFANFIIDYVINYFLSYVLIVGVILLLSVIVADVEALLYAIDNIPWILDVIISNVITVFFYFLTETLLKGKTVGKLITKTIVVNEHGEVPDSGVIFVRSFCRMIPFNALSFLGEYARGWHDSISKTYVVKTEELEKAKFVTFGLEEIGTTIE